MCGKVRTETIKRIARDLLARFTNQFNKDFDNNKQVLAKITKTSLKHFRNRIAGYIIRLVVIEKNKEQMENTGFNI